MKNICISLIAFLCCFNSYSQNVFISGKIKNPKGEKVRVTMNDLEGEATLTSESKIDKEGKFSLSFELKDPGKAGLEHGDEISEMFLHPGDSLFITLDTKEFDETISYKGRGSEVNNFLAKRFLWEEDPKNDFNTLKWAAFKKLDETGFAKYSDSIQKVKTDYYKNNFNQNFSKSFQDYVMAEIEYSTAEDKLNYHGLHAYTNKLNKKAPNKDPHYYDFLKNIKIQNEEALNVPEYARFLNLYIWKVINDSLYKNDTIYNNDRRVNLTKARYNFAKHKFSGKVREAVLAGIIKDYLNSDVNPSSANILLNDYKSLNPSNNHIEEIEKIYSVKDKISQGKPAINFSYPDENGKVVSLSDLKGKYVYVDLWASWCGPCRREMPYSKKMIEKLKDKNVHFVFLSIDQSEDAWRKAMKAENMPGIHLLAKEGFEAEVMKSYGVKGIPHYLLIDPAGNIVSSDASRPSGSIEKELEDLLK